MTIPEHSDDKSAMSWPPTTLEDRLLARYHEAHPGIMFLELPLGGSDPNHGPPRLDGLLVPGPESSVHPQGTFTQAEAEEAIAVREVHLLEAKRHLNRNVVGQIAVGARMLRDTFEAAKVSQSS